MKSYSCGIKATSGRSLIGGVRVHETCRWDKRETAIDLATEYYKENQERGIACEMLPVTIHDQPAELTTNSEGWPEMVR